MQSRFVADGDRLLKCSFCLSRGALHGLSQRQLCSDWIVRFILDRSKNYGIPRIACKCIFLGSSLQKNVENNFSSFFGMASHHVHKDSYDQNIPIRNGQTRRKCCSTSPPLTLRERERYQKGGSYSHISFIMFCHRTSELLLFHQLILVSIWIIS